MEKHTRNTLPVPNIESITKRLDKTLKAFSMELKRQKELLEYNKQNLKIGDEVEYKNKFWAIEAFSTSKEYAKLTAYKQQPVLAHLSGINDYE